MDNQKSFREKKLVEILIVIVIIVFLVGSIVFAFVNRTHAPSTQHNVTSAIPQDVLDSLSAHSTTTTTGVPESVLNSLSASKNNVATTIPQSVINSLSASPKK